MELTKEQQALIESVADLPRWTAKTFAARGFDFDECESFAVNGLIDAARTYDANTGVKFRTYAQRKAKWAVQTAIDNGFMSVIKVTQRGRRNLGVEAAGRMSSPVSLNDELHGDTAPERFMDGDIVRAAVRSLPGLYGRVVELHAFHGLTFRQVAEQLGRSQPGVFETWKDALSMLRDDWLLAELAAS